MTLIKQKIFFIPFKDANTNIDIDNKINKEIESFLNDDNIVYLDHSISIAPSYTEQSYTTQMGHIHKYGGTISKFVVLSIMYKDLSASVPEISKLTPKAKQQIKEVTKGGNVKIDMPDELKD